MTNHFVARALTGEPVWSIGQIDKATQRELDKLVKAGTLLRGRGHWAGLSPLKTVWYRPGALFTYLEMPA